MKAWYFSKSDRRLGHGDGRLIEIGETACVSPPIKLCKHGLHASVHALDALAYAPGPILWRVQLGGEVVEGEDKACATERTYIAGGVDATTMLRAFARWCALQVAHLWDCPDVTARYLVSGDEQLRDAAYAAAHDAQGATWAAYDAAHDAQGATWVAYDAARAAARAAWAAYDAARDAAWAAWAAYDAAYAAAHDAAWAAWAAYDAAYAAARAAAKAAQAAQKNMFEQMCCDLIDGQQWWEK